MYQFEEWLRQLRLARQGPVQLSATRSLRFATTISLPGNLTTATLTGQVRAAPDAGTVLAQFTVGTPAYADGRTSWAVSLAAGSGSNSTGVLPDDLTGDGVVHLPYDFLLTLSGGSPGRLFGGPLSVTGFISQPA